MTSLNYLLPLSCILLLGALTACGEAGAPAPPALAGNAHEAPQSNACEIVTRERASDLFGQPAIADSGHSAVTMIDQCLWTWDTDTSNQLLQFHIWDPRGYSMPEDAEPLDIGEGGYIRQHPVGGVDISWLQDNRLISLAYSTIGPDAPKATERAEQMITLARQVEAEL